tara:strand:+ start:482 stop:727 length:246 start_codon:yes stop_codon:yes gene_type:complete
MKDLKHIQSLSDFINEAHDSAGHPSHIRIRNTKADRINRVNKLYNAYMNLAKHMEDSGEPEEKVQKVKDMAEKVIKDHLPK